VLHRQETGRSVEHAEDAVRLTDGTERLRAHVLAGEAAVAQRMDVVDPGGDLIAAIAELRRS